MGGQACVLYGAAEFSRDTDIALLASNENLELLKAALRTLQARRIALPPFDISFLLKGHAIHFRSYHPESHRIRIDVMSIMRGTDAFEKLWQRRVRHILPQGEIVELLSLPDLVRTKSLNAEPKGLPEVHGRGYPPVEALRRRSAALRGGSSGVSEASRYRFSSWRA